MDRKEELKKIVTSNNELVAHLIEDAIFMEKKLNEYMKLPQISVNPKNKTQQKATPAAKLYKETLQQYTNVIKVLASCAMDDVSDEESPLRKWAAARMMKDG